MYVYQNISCQYMYIYVHICITLNLIVYEIYLVLSKHKGRQHTKISVFVYISNKSDPGTPPHALGKASIKKPISCGPVRNVLR